MFFNLLRICYAGLWINLFIFAPCYIKLLKNLDYYMSLDIVPLNRTSKYLNCNPNYPIGIIDDEIEVHFLHYTSIEEACKKWNERRLRINFSNLFITMTDQDACTYSLIKEFDNLPYENKIFFSAKNYPEIKSLVWCKKYNNWISPLENQTKV